LSVLQSLTDHLHRGNWNQASQVILEAAARQTQSQCGLAGVLVETGALRVLALYGSLPASTRSGTNPHSVAMAAFQQHGYVEFTNFDNVLGRVITSGQPVLINELSKDLLPPGHPPVRHFLGVPMRCGPEVVGVITVANRPGGYTERELAKVAVLAQSAGMLFECYRRYQRELQLKIEREQLSRRLLQTQEAERQHLARELHDEIGQVLTAIRLNLHSLQGPSGPANLERKVPETMQLVDTLLQQVRRLSLDLHPQQLDVLGLGPALRDHVNQLRDRAGLHCRFLAAQAMPRLDPAIELACFRVAQEALTNVVRHAQARTVSVELLQDAEALHLKIQDDGVGFDYAAARFGAGREGKLGLLGMEERVALVGGRLACKSQPRHGTQIHASFPLAPAGRP
jgi:signal transduction histidine kinase